MLILNIHEYVMNEWSVYIWKVLFQIELWTFKNIFFPWCKLLGISHYTHSRNINAMLWFISLISKKKLLSIIHQLFFSKTCLIQTLQMDKQYFGVKLFIITYWVTLRSVEHTSELQAHSEICYAVVCLDINTI